jgi:hypothetical protein
MLKMGRRLLGQHTRLSLCAFDPQQCDKGCLASGLILAGGFAELGGGAAGIKHVVGDLEGGADIPAIRGDLLA